MNVVVRLGAVLTGAVLACSALAQAPPAAWLRHYNGPDSLNDTGAQIDLGPDGTVTIVGISESLGNEDDVATVRYDANGNELWVARYDGSTNWIDQPAGMDVDSAGNTFVVSHFWTGTKWTYSLVKYAPDGSTAWIREFVGPGALDDRPAAVVADEEGGAYVAGYVFVEPGQFIYFAAHFYVARYDADGDISWEVFYDIPAHNGAGAEDLRMAPDGNLVATGWVRATISDDDFLTMKVSPQGEILWVRQWDSGGTYNGMDGAVRVRTDRSGNVYALGQHFSDVFEDNFDATLLKYSADGTFQWVASMDFIRADGFGELIDDEAGNLYLSGGWDNSLDVDGFVVSFTPNGQERWRLVFDGPTSYDFQEALSIMQGPDGLLYVGLDWQYPDAGGYDYTVALVDTDGEFLDQWRYDTGNSSDTFYSLGGWAMDEAGNIFVGAYSGSSDGTGANYTTLKIGIATCAAPGEVSNVLHGADKVTLQWDPLDELDWYDVARGAVGDLQLGEPAACMAAGTFDTFFDDFDLPLSGTGFYYLVRAGNECGVGPWGSGQTSQPRNSTCP